MAERRRQTSNDVLGKQFSDSTPALSGLIPPTNLKKELRKFLRLKRHISCEKLKASIYKVGDSGISQANPKGWSKEVLRQKHQFQR